jgi:hypothetical protein
MRELEAKHAKATQTVDGRSQDEQDDWDSIAPVMMEVKKTVLQSTNDAVSDAGLEALARWKLGLPQVKKDSVKPD